MFAATGEAAGHEGRDPGQDRDAEPKGTALTDDVVGQARQGGTDETAQALQTLQAAQGGALAGVIEASRDQGSQAG